MYHPASPSFDALATPRLRVTLTQLVLPYVSVLTLLQKICIDLVSYPLVATALRTYQQHTFSLLTSLNLTSYDCSSKPLYVTRNSFPHRILLFPLKVMLPNFENFSICLKLSQFSIKFEPAIFTNLALVILPQVLLIFPKQTY